MNNTKMIIAGLLLTGLSMSAGEPFSLKKEGKDESSQAFKLDFRKKQSAFKLNVKQSNILSSSAKDWDESEVTGSGLFLNFGLHFPSASFLNPYYATNPIRFGLGLDFEFGSFFRFGKIAEHKFGVGLRATWLSFSYTSAKDGNDIYRALQISPVRLGPQFSMAITESMGFDVYYQIGVNFTEMFGSIDDPNETENIGYSKTYLGASHEIGAAYHFRVYSVGFGYRFGSLSNILTYYDGETEDNDIVKSSISNFRITLGFKF
ncbi:hypothetical protein [Aurantibacillus circumpalustris]|uniref:hypothetical protein n=1 Tax=Aurantibacillus circumpalustris TaxID=3036359 RepID=UPI00295C2E4B|nr:hypothetical protein [Aurantibacillus circumpalustris]